MTIKICRCGRLGIYGTESCTTGGCIGEPAKIQELRLKRAVVAIIDRGKYPASHRIVTELDYDRSAGTLSGRENRWKCEILTALRWKQTICSDGSRGGWRKPL